MKKIIQYAALAILIASCGQGYKTDINCEYPGGIIYEKYDFREFDGTIHFDIKYKGQMFYVEAYEIDFNYKAGDTINKPCAK